MGSVSYEYEYTNSDIKHPAKTPMTEKEYKQVRKDVDQFLENFVKKAEPEFEKQVNPHRFRWKRFLILLGIGILLIIIEFSLKAMEYYDAGDIFDMLSYVPFFLILLQPFLWVFYAFKSPDIYSYKKRATTYYQFHCSKANESKNYEDYLRIISETNIGEYPTERRRVPMF
ncbi:MAG: hypothetical protein ABIQ40_01800 [Bacteroidia bacterium]